VEIVEKPCIVFCFANNVFNNSYNKLC